MPQIKSAASIAEKWKRVTPQRTQDYSDGVTNPGKDWATETAAAEDRYKEGVIKAANRGAFGQGVKNAGTQKWQQKTLDLGVNRWGEGVSAAGSDYEQGFAPYAETIKNTNLPPRFAKGDPRNLDRVKVMSTALRNKKIQLTGG